MQEIQKIVDEKVKAMVDDGVIKKTIEESIEKAVLKAFTSQFESYGAITQQIEKAIKDGLKINLNDLPFETYNEQMLVAVKAKLSGVFQGAASERFMSEMDRILAPAPSEMNIKDFVESIAKTWKTDEPWDANDLDHRATVEINNDSIGNSASCSLKMWKQKTSSRFSSARDNGPDLHLYIDSAGRIRINHKHSYKPTCFEEHEALIFKLYAAGTKLTGLDEFDPDDCDLTLKESED